MNRIFNVGRVAAMAAAGILAVAIGGPASAQEAKKAKVDFEGVTGLPTVLKNTGIVDEPEITPAESSVSVKFVNGMRLDGGKFTNVYGAGKRGTCTGCNGGVTIVFAEPVPDVSLDLTNMSGGTRNYRVWLNDVWLDGPSTPSVEQNVGNAETGRIDIPAATHGLVRSIRISPNGLSTFYVDNVAFVAGATGHEVAFRAFIPGASAPVGPNDSCVAMPEKMSDGVTAAPQVFRGASRPVTSATRRELYIASGDGLMYQSVTVAPDAETDDDLVTARTSEAVEEIRVYAEDALQPNGSNTFIDLALKDGKAGDCHWYEKSHAPDAGATDVEVTRDGSLVSMRFFGSLNTPLGGKSASSALDWDLTVTLDTSVTPASWTVSGAHDGFPAYEIEIGGKTKYTSDPGDWPYSDANVRRLRGPMEVRVDEEGVLN